MNILNFFSIFLIVKSSNLPLPEPQSNLQKITSYAKNVYFEAINYSKCYLEVLQDKAVQAKDFIMGKINNLRKRGDPVFVGDEGQEDMPEFSEAELKELFEKLFKDMNLGDNNEQNEEVKEDSEKKEEENEEKPL